MSHTDSSTHTPATHAIEYSGTQGKILELLGNGLSPEIVSSHVGVSPSYISQLLSEEQFASRVTALRFQNLQAATERDRKYDHLEDRLLERMQDLLPLMYKPMEVLRAITTINGAKRRGATAPENTHINNTVVNLTIPIQTINKFSVNSSNQVVEITAQQGAAQQGAKSQTLVTMPSAQLLSKVTSPQQPSHKLENHNEYSSYPEQNSICAST